MDYLVDENINEPAASPADSVNNTEEGNVKMHLNYFLYLLKYFLHQPSPELANKSKHYSCLVCCA